MTRVRNFEDVRFGEYLIKTWYVGLPPLRHHLRNRRYYSPYPLPLEETPPMNSTPLSFSALPIGPITSNSRKRNAMSMDGDAPVPSASKPRGLGKRSSSDLFTLGAGQSGEGARGRLWVCDLCFKYMRTRAGFDRHTSSCTMMQPPGRKVYQRGSYTIWEVDGAQATLYCQNLSLFGKLFIDHKSVFFHVDNFLFYALCDAATSRRDQVMAFFSKVRPFKMSS